MLPMLNSKNYIVLKFATFKFPFPLSPFMIGLLGFGLGLTSCLNPLCKQTTLIQELNFEDSNNSSYSTFVSKHRTVYKALTSLSPNILTTVFHKIHFFIDCFWHNLIPQETTSCLFSKTVAFLDKLQHFFLLPKQIISNQKLNLSEYLFRQLSIIEKQHFTTQLLTLLSEKHTVFVHYLQSDAFSKVL